MKKTVIGGFLVLYRMIGSAAGFAPADALNPHREDLQSHFCKPGRLSFCIFRLRVYGGSGNFGGGVHQGNGAQSGERREKYCGQAGFLI